MSGETLYSYIIGMLHDLLVKEGVYLQPFEGPVDDLRVKLAKMEELLEFADIRRDKRTAEIIELADHLIDFIEKYILPVEVKHIGFRERLLRPKVFLAIQNITSKINEFLKSQSGARDTPKRAYKVQDLSRFNEKDFVGRDTDITSLVSYLVDEDDEHFSVISIYGMGGLGKTTLARKLYKDKKVLSHFKSFAFVCVSEQCQADDILKHILQQLIPHMTKEIKDMENGDVIERLQRVEGENKCLVVIDDIWSIRDWESLYIGLPNGCNGSKVLLTTRIKEVADKGFCYSLKCLSEEQSWELFQKKILLGQDTPVEKRMEEIGREMIAWCRGIPLAVLVLRGVLVTKGSLREWQRFYESKNKGGELYEQFKGEVRDELLFSYVELPYPLKTCFLHLANFAEDEEINVDDLYMLWDAEGMILSKDKGAGETNLDVAQRYLGELVGRSMVEAEVVELVHPNDRGRFKSCRLHDLMRELCLSVVKKENFLKVHDNRCHRDGVVVLNSSSLKNDTKMPPRQAWYFSQHQDFEVHDKEKVSQHVRSLRLIKGRVKRLSKLKKLSSLRALTISGTYVGKGVSINELTHLRYLKLHLSFRKKISSIENLIYLQTLDIQHGHDMFLPLTLPEFFLRRLKRLRHLFLPNDHTYRVRPEGSRLRMDGLTELETLVNVDSRKCEMKDVIQLTKLRRLECSIYISSEDDAKVLMEFMDKVNWVPSAYLLCGIILENREIEVYSEILRGQLPEYWKGNFNKLEIWSLRGKLLPEFSNYNQLTELLLGEFEFEEDPMPTLEKLSNLKSLGLYNGILKGKEMAISAMGFPRLTYMSLWGLEKWENWRVEEGAMPNLRTLWIEKCPGLEKLPDGLKFITSLEHLEIGGMPEGFNRRLNGGEGGGGEEGPDYHIIQHVPHVALGTSISLLTRFLFSTSQG